MHEESKEKLPNVYVYVPDQARLNIDSIGFGPPQTTYDDRMVILDRHYVKNQVTQRDTEANDQYNTKNTRP